MNRRATTPAAGEPASSLNLLQATANDSGSVVLLQRLANLAQTSVSHQHLRTPWQRTSGADISPNHRQVETDVPIQRKVKVEVTDESPTEVKLRAYAKAKRFDNGSSAKREGWIGVDKFRSRAKIGKDEINSGELENDVSKGGQAGHVLGQGLGGLGVPNNVFLQDAHVNTSVYPAVFEIPFRNALVSTPSDTMVNFHATLWGDNIRNGRFPKTNPKDFKGSTESESSFTSYSDADNPSSDKDQSSITEVSASEDVPGNVDNLFSENDQSQKTQASNSEDLPIIDNAANAAPQPAPKSQHSSQSSSSSSSTSSDKSKSPRSPSRSSTTSSRSASRSSDPSPPGKKQKINRHSRSKSSDSDVTMTDMSDEQRQSISNSSEAELLLSDSDRKYLAKGASPSNLRSSTSKSISDQSGRKNEPNKRIAGPSNSADESADSTSNDYWD